MAVEDGAVLGYLLGKANRQFAYSAGNEQSFDYIKSVLRLYEKLRKARTTVNTKGAVANRTMYHLPDGTEQQQRDEELRDFDYINGCSDIKWADSVYQQDMLGFDAVEDAKRAFTLWYEQAPKL
jgi:salicylate hydroxylase